MVPLTSERVISTLQRAASAGPHHRPSRSRHDQSHASDHHALRARRVPIAGTVFNHSTDGRQGPAERTNPAVIEHLSGVPVLGQVRYDQRISMPLQTGW